MAARPEVQYPNWYDDPYAADPPLPPVVGKSALEKQVDDLAARVAALEARLAETSTP